MMERLARLSDKIAGIILFKKLRQFIAWMVMRFVYTDRATEKAYVHEFKNPEKGWENYVAKHIE